MQTLKALSAEDNAELLKKAKSGDLEARELFFAHNYRLMWHFVRKNESKEQTKDEVLSAAQYGFLKAYNSFDLNKGVKFATYAARCMQNEIWMQHRSKKKLRIVDSLDTPVYTDDDGNELTLTNLLTSPESGAYDAQIESDALQDILNEFCAKASLRDRQIVHMRYMQEMTQKEIGRVLEISQSYITRLEKRILKKLRQISENQMKRVKHMPKEKYFNPHLLVDRDTFIEQNITLAHKVANKYNHLLNRKSLLLEYGDILAHAIIGMMQAYDNFDPTKFLTPDGKAVQFSTYGVPKMIGEIQRMLRGTSEGAKFSRSYKEAYYKINRADLLDESADNIAKTLGMNIKDVKKGLEYRDHRQCVYLDAPLETFEGDSNLLDIVGDSVNFDSNVIIDEFLTTCTPKERQVFNIQKSKGIKQREIGKSLGISQVQVSRLQKRVLNKAELQHKKEMEEMSKSQNYVGALKWLFENTNLNNVKIANVSKVSYPTVNKYRKFFDAGQLTVDADPLAANLVNASEIIDFKSKSTTKGILELNEQRRQTKTTDKIEEENIETSEEKFKPRSFQIPKKESIEKDPTSSDELIQTYEVVQAHMEDEETAKKADNATEKQSKKETPIINEFDSPYDSVQFTSRIVNQPSTISLALEDIDSYNIDDAFNYLRSQLHENKKYRISIRIEQVK